MASSTDKTAVDRYFLALNSMARDAYLACFSEDALVMDPYGGRPLQGVAGLHKFMDGMERTWSSFTMTPDAPFVAADRVAVSWRCTATAKSGKVANFAGIDVFTLNENGLISQLEGYWDFQAMIAQIS
ncbi:MAG: nuclear transport factor 2 family protein [Chloroflexota bacterium]|nr:nuclear transport factor 2 family protein [Ardenticatenaceae bacterium]